VSLEGNGRGWLNDRAAEKHTFRGRVSEDPMKRWASPLRPRIASEIVRRKADETIGWKVDDECGTDGDLSVLRGRASDA